MIEPINGVIVIDKPVGPTSFAIVRQARHATGARKVGHGGTLDPLASGVLPICFGEATKLAQFLLDADKEYEAVFTFGTETDSYDSMGQVTAHYPTDDLDEEKVRQALGTFLGAQLQVPPMYSALKRAGRALYEYARAGEEVQREPRPVSIHALALRAFARERLSGPAASIAVSDAAVPAPPPMAAAAPWVQVFIRCSKGTYVRSLAFDLGRALGTGAHLSALRRTRSGPFALNQAISPQSLGQGPLPIVSPADALAHLPAVRVAADVAVELAHGKSVTWARAVTAPGAAGLVEALGGGPVGGLVRILTPNGHLLAVAPRGDPEALIRTMRVFRPLDGQDS